MAKKTVLMKIDLKAAAEAVLSRLGLSMNTAINIFFRQVIFHNGMPFDVESPKKDGANSDKE